MSGRPGVRPHLLFRGLDPHGHLDITRSGAESSYVWAILVNTTIRLKDGDQDEAHSVNQDQGQMN